MTDTTIPADSLRRGIDQASRGELADKGSFARYADEDGDDNAPVQMCCDGGTAEDHRHSSPDGRCCVDHVD